VGGGFRKSFELICCKFISFRLHIKQLLAQYFPLLNHTLLLSPWELPDGFTEPFISGAVMPLTDSHLLIIEAPYTILRERAVFPPTADNRQ